MAKHLIALVTSLSVFIFIAGCPEVKPEPIEPIKTETLQVQIQKPEPNEIELSAIEPAPPFLLSQESRGVEGACPEPVEGACPEPVEGPPRVEPPKPEPNEVKPAKIEPPQDELLTTEPTKVQYSMVEPNAIEPNEVEPNDVEAVTRQRAPAPREPGRRVFFHDKCADILNNFVDEDGMVDYQALRRKRLELKKLLNEFDELDPNEYNSWPKEDKIAFWINAYNIQMLNIIIANHPIDASRILSLFWGPYSIRHIKGIWTDYKFMVMDEEFTLREIQQRFFHKEFEEPQIYFALSYASLSSPPLRNEPYYGYKLSQQLEDQTKRFLSSGCALKIDRDKRTVYLSAILQSTWHGQEFIGKFGTDKKFKDQQPATRAVLNFITNYIAQRDVDFLEVENYSVEYMKYDWTLNDSSRTQ